MTTLSASSIASARSFSVRRRVLALALPAVGEQLLNTAVGLVDIYLVGNLSAAAAAKLGYNSATALSAAGLANQMVWLATVFYIALGVGSMALVARAIGAKDEAQMVRVVRQSFMLAGVVGLLVSLLAFVGAGLFLAVLGAPAEVAPLGVQYIHLSALALLPTALLFVGNAMLRGVGDTRTPLLVMLGVNAANMLIAWLLVNGNFGLPALGVLGAATGAAVARGGGGLVLLGLLLKGHSGLRLLPSLRPDPETLRRLMKLALPTAGEQMVFQVALLIFVHFVTDLGTAAYAAHNLSITIESVSFLPGLGYAAATTALVGQSLGARRPRQAERYALEALLQGGLMMTLLGLVLVAFPRQLLAIFINDPAVIATATTPLRMAGLAQPALACSFIMLGALRGAGDAKFPLYSRLITTWAVRLPLTFLLVGALGFGLNGIWMAMCSDFSLQAALAIWRFKTGKWKQIEV